jgi:hypothetical protein
MGGSLVPWASRSYATVALLPHTKKEVVMMEIRCPPLTLKGQILKANMLMMEVITLPTTWKWPKKAMMMMPKIMRQMMILKILQLMLLLPRILEWRLIVVPTKCIVDVMSSRRSVMPGNPQDLNLR